MIEALSINDILFDKYRLHERIGIGGMTEIWRAEILDPTQLEIQGSRFAALSVINSNFISHSQARQAFEHQYRVACLMKHPNIVRVFEYAEDKKKNIPFIVMELLEGKTLYQFVKEEHIKKISIKKRFEMIEKVANAIIFVHEQGYVHSDIKSDNIFLLNNGDVKLYDFSISRKLNDHKVFDAKLGEYDAAQLGALTHSYASLEMIQGKPPHTSDDVYSFALVVYYILTSRHAYERLSAQDAMEKKLRPEKIKGINKRQNMAIQKALSFKQENRFATIEDFCDELKPRMLDLF